jgi:lipopolysaccharide transport system ATP-binding protein
MPHAIIVEHLSKQYSVDRLSPRAEYRMLRESLIELASAPFRAWRKSRGAGTAEPFWALRDVGFEIEPGEAVGLIGRNGAGKSTLLKVLSRITKPTRGRVEVRGRVASLLEVGTGFHPELTGRENVYLNGVLLGMTCREVARKFEEIVAFAGVGPFLDLPVKRYSSGMQMRLAFAVAAHLEPEVIVVDEVLAVGDAEFQRKCLGKMGQVARSGRTVLFVSHNMAAVQHLCTRAIFLKQGTVAAAGPCAEVIRTYLGSFSNGMEGPTGLDRFRAPSMMPVIRSVEVLDGAGQPAACLLAGAPMVVRLEYDAPVPLRRPRFGIFVETVAGQRLFFLQTWLQHGDLGDIAPRGRITCTVPALPLAPGMYYLTLNCSLAHQRLDSLDRAVTLHVEAADYFGTGHLPYPDQGPFLVPARWEIDG